MEAWRTLSLAPFEWAARLQGCASCSRRAARARQLRNAAIARSQAAVLELFDGAMEEAARRWAERPVPLREFWRAAKSVLAADAVARRRRPPQRGARAGRARGAAVAVAGGFRLRIGGEAIPEIPHAGSILSGSGAGAVEAGGHPAAHGGRFRSRRTLPVRFGRDARHRIAHAQLPAMRRARATESAVAVPRWRGRGAESAGNPCCRSREGAGEAVARPPSVIASPDLLEHLALRHQSFGPRSLESYLQCPFQFFGRYTLHLHPAPLRPEKRLDF
jgi:hypothetical protein